MSGKCLHNNMGSARYIYNILFSKRGEEKRIQKKEMTTQDVTAEKMKTYHLTK